MTCEQFKFQFTYTHSYNFLVNGNEVIQIANVAFLQAWCVYYTLQVVHRRKQICQRVRNIRFRFASGVQERYVWSPIALLARAGELSRLSYSLTSEILPTPCGLGDHF